MEENKKTILLIESDDDLRDVIEKKLSTAGYNVSIAKDGKSGLEQMRLKSPDLVIVDLVLTIVSGMEVLEKMREEKSLFTIPVIVLTDVEKSIEMDRVKGLDFKDYFVKKLFSPDELLDKVKEEVPINGEIKRGSKMALKGIKILIIEDDEFLSDMLASKLGREGSDLKNASDGEKALEILKTWEPQLILLDIILPNMSGFEVLEQIKKNDAVKDVPVIILSNLGQQEDVKKGLSLGAKDFLIKANFTIDEIILKINKHIKT